MGSILQLVAGLDFSSLPQQIVIGLLKGAVYALIALGYTMVYGILRLINFAHGEVFMLGAYMALFVSWAAIGVATVDVAGPLVQSGTLSAIGLGMIMAGAIVAGIEVARGAWKSNRRAIAYLGSGLAVMGGLSILLAKFQPQAINLVLMLFASMIACALVGVIIEFFAYRPMRNQPRIAALITAIGVSLFIQFSGQLFLPNAPPPSISESVNPYKGSVAVNLKAPPAERAQQLTEAQLNLDAKRAAFEEVKRVEADEFNLSAQGIAVRDAFRTAEREFTTLESQVRAESVRINVPQGQLIMLVTAVLLMVLLRHLVMKTAVGRAMRAVAHDFDSASLMGVSVNRIVTFTFIIGSALAGAGAMMNATFMGTPLTPFYGLMPGVKAFVAAVLGGIGNIPGAVLGGLLMGIAENMVVWVGYSQWQDAIAFVVLIVVLLFRPGGLLGSSKVEKV